MSKIGSFPQLWNKRGFIGYYTRFIQDLWVIAKPLADLLNKYSFKLSPLATNAFDKLKLALTVLPVLALPDTGKTEINTSVIESVFCWCYQQSNTKIYSKLVQIWNIIFLYHTKQTKFVKRTIKLKGREKIGCPIKFFQIQ